MYWDLVLCEVFCGTRSEKTIPAKEKGPSLGCIGPPMDSAAITRAHRGVRDKGLGP